MAPFVLLDARKPWTTAGVAPALSSRKRAMAPETCGVAVEVPDIVVDAVSDAIELETTSTPGAKRSTQAPKFEKSARRSWGSLAATVRTPGARAGLAAQASAESFMPAT